MTNGDFRLDRRVFIGAGFGMAASHLLPDAASAQAPAKQSTLGLRVISTELKIRPNAPPSPVWALVSDQPDAAVRFTRGEELTVLLKNEVSAPIALNLAGFSGSSSFEPLTGASTIPGGGQGKMIAPLRQAGTFLIDPRLLGDGADRPMTTSSFVVEGAKLSGAERDELLLIEDWRIKADGRALSAGRSPEDADTFYTINGLPPRDIKLQQNERMRFRIINGCQRTPIGLRIDKFDVRVMAIDSQPAEPFVARDGQIVLAPGSRLDALIDATPAAGTASDIVMHDGTVPRTIGRLLVTNPPERPAPLPPPASLSSAHLPQRLDLKSAQRVELQFDAKAPDSKASWTAPTAFTKNAQPLFQTKRNRTVVMAITNPTAAPVAFRLHGHHFRLLDRLDDGWKPFWLDTLLVDKGQTQRIAFLAEHSGQWLIESAGIDWAAPKLLRSYNVA